MPVCLCLRVCEESCACVCVCVCVRVCVCALAYKACPAAFAQLGLICKEVCK